MEEHFIKFLEAVQWWRLLYSFVIAVALWGLVFMATLIDLRAGVKKAKALKQPIHSHGYRQTFRKLSEYWLVLMMALFMDAVFNLLPWYGLPYMSILAVAACIGIETRSVLENLKAKKSAACGIPTMISQIIACKDVAKAAELIVSLSAALNTANQNQNNNNNPL